MLSELLLNFFFRRETEPTASSQPAVPPPDRVSILFNEYETQLTTERFVEQAGCLNDVEREQLHKMCCEQFARTKRVWYAEAADALAMSLGYSSTDAYELWKVLLTHPSFDAISDKLLLLLPDDVKCIIAHCRIAANNSGDHWFQYVAEYIANDRGWPDVHDADWGPYRDGETGPGVD